MKCPFCNQAESRVIDSRLNQLGDITRRRRVCPRCEGRFTTYERVEEVMPAVIKKDGRREPFDREKIIGGIKMACQKRPVMFHQIEDAVRGIERRIQSFGLKEIPSKTIGKMVMSKLHAIDKVAYVRFASVYREFHDVNEFVTELRDHPIEPDPQDQSSLSFPFVSQGDAP